MSAFRWGPWNLYRNLYCRFLCRNDSWSCHVGTTFWLVWKKTCHGCNINMYEFGFVTDWQGNVFCIVIFSFSTNYIASVVIRLIHGLLDGVIPIAKTIVSEISNERNIALGTSSIFVGVAIGGYSFSKIIQIQVNRICNVWLSFWSYTNSFPCWPLSHIWESRIVSLRFVNASNRFCSPSSFLQF